jgi:hypothetical protein
MLQMAQVLERVYVPLSLCLVYLNQRMRPGHPGGGQKPLAQIHQIYRLNQVLGRFVYPDHCRPHSRKEHGQGARGCLDPLSTQASQPQS